MNDKHAKLDYLAARLLRIGGDELTVAARLVSAALSLNQLHPEAEHALFTELWGHVTRALNYEDFASMYYDELNSLEAELAGHVLTYRLARGWLVRGADAPSLFPSFSATIAASS